MYKIYSAQISRCIACFYPKLWLTMKLTFILMVVCVMQATSATYAQKLDLNLKDATIKEAFKIIKKRTGYEFLYNADMLPNAHNISVVGKNISLKDALDAVFANQQVTYVVDGNTIVVKEKPKVIAEVAKVASVISGVVKDETGLSVPGVTVKIKNTSTGVATSQSGAYKITVENTNAILVFSSIGYITQEISASKGPVINITLKEDSKGLSEIVVIGYGEVKRQDLTGAVSTVKVAELQKSPVRSFEEALAGRVAGVQVASGDGQPGSASNIIIRGANSVTQDNSPLYVVDGFPIENPNNNVINPNDIATIDVLKDASATAIYGARGANGVIMITTKKGKGATTLSYDAYYGYNSAIKQLEVLSPYEFVKLQKEAFGILADTTYLKNATLEDYKNVPAVNWQDQLFRTAPFQNHSLAIRGGNGNGTNYSISGSIVDQAGLIINSGFNRYQGRVVVDQKINEKLQSGININYAKTKSFGAIVSQYATPTAVDYQFAIIPNAIGYRPLGGVLGAGADINNLNDNLLDGDLDNSVSTTSDYRYNPISSVANEVNIRNLNDIIANAFLQYKILPDLTLKVSGGFNSTANTTNVFNNSHTRSGDIRTPQGVNGPNGSVSNNQVNSFLSENTLTYNKQIHTDHNLTVLAGFTYQGTNYSSFGYSANQVPNENLGISGMDEGLPSGIQSYKSSNRLESVLGRVNYNYKSLYYLTASFRSDGSSKFPPKNQWSYFPSVGGSWRVMKENFMKNVSFISDLKVRASYGKTGNNRVSDFAYLPAIKLPIASNYSYGNGYVYGADLSALGNPDLKWETTAQIDAGLDVEFMKGRIGVSVDYYNKKTSDLLLNANLPGSTGFLAAFQNIGKVQNKGWEFSLSTKNIDKADFPWNSSFNISFNSNKVLALVSGQESILTVVNWADNQYRALPHYIAKIGQPVAQMYGYVFDGLYQYSDFDKSSTGAYILKENLPNNGSTRTSIQPGYVKYKDLNGDGVVNTQDQTAIGRAFPLHFGGFNNNFRYKNFDLNVFMQWSYGNDIVNATRYRFEGYPKFNQNMLASYANRWTPKTKTPISHQLLVVVIRFILIGLLKMDLTCV